MTRTIPAALALGFAFSLGLALGDGATQQATAAVSDLQTDEQNTIAVFAAASPSVVFVESNARRRDPWTRNVFETPRGSGTGFAWDDAGHIVTNFHVVQGASSLVVKLQDGSSIPATVVGSDPSKDLAVLQLASVPDTLVPLSRGGSGDLQVGQKVIAIGNPFGLDHTLTSGVISALGREIQAVNGRTIYGAVQTDAAINPGNSGGPLLDSQGRLIGVNTSIYSPSGASAGIGFAIPAEIVSRIVPMLITDGKVRRPALGIHIVGDHVARRLGVNGVIVRSVSTDSPASEALLMGLQQDSNGDTSIGDVLTALGDYAITDADSLFVALEAHEVGERTVVQVLRDGKTLQLDIELGEFE